MAHDGFNRLGRVLQGRMSEMGATSPILDFGTIRKDLALIPDDCDDIIFEPGEYEILSRADDWKVQSGDRVVIAWVGSEVVVLGKIGG